MDCGEGAGAGIWLKGYSLIAAENPKGLSR